MRKTTKSIHEAKCNMDKILSSKDELIITIEKETYAFLIHTMFIIKGKKSERTHLLPYSWFDDPYYDRLYITKTYMVDLKSIYIGQQ